MKTKIIGTLIFAAFISLSACKKDKVVEPVVQNFDMTINEGGAIPNDAAALVKLIPAGVYVTAYQGAFETKTQATLDSKGINKDDVSYIKCKTLSVSITNNPNQKLDFMDSIKVFVDQVGGNNPILLGYKYNYPTGLRTLDLDMTDVDVKDIFRADSALLILGGTKRAGIDSIEGGTYLNIHASINGQAILKN